MTPMCIKAWRAGGRGFVNPRGTKPVLKEADVRDRFSKDFGKLLRTLYAWTLRIVLPYLSHRMGTWDSG